MANTDQVEIEGVKVKPAVGLMSLIAAVTVAVVVAVAATGGVAYWLVRSGKLPLQGGSAVVKAAAVEGPAAKHEVALEPLLVNLADAGGQAYLRVGMTLSVLDTPAGKGDRAKEEKPEKGKASVPHEAELRDAVLNVIGRETTDDLLGPDGKDRLKQGLRIAMAAHVPEMKVVDLYFTEFLVQR